MADSAVLKEFLVKIGFKVDEGKFRRFQEVMNSTGKAAFELGKTTLAASSVMEFSLSKIGQQLESLYYAARRTGASAGELKSFGFAASQIGVSAEEAQGAIEGLAAARRTNPGLGGILSGLGIDPRQTDNAKVMLQLLIKLRGMPYFQGAQVASMFGINEHTFQMLEAGLPEMQKFLALREKMFRAAGIDPDAMTARSHEFMTHLRTMGAALENLADIVAYRLMPWGEKLIDWISNVVMWFTRADKATDGWSSKLLGLAGILGGGAALKGGLGLLGKIFGGGAKSVVIKGGAAAAEGAAAAGGAEAAAGGALLAGGEAAGGGLLAGVALPAIIIAAVGAALVWMMTHKEQVRAAVSEAFDWTKKTADAVKTDVGAGFHAMGDAATKAGGWMKALAMQPGFLGDLGRLTGKFEGFKNKVYRDVAGNLTFGFGHKLKPGENMQGADPMKLFSKDLSSSLGDVLSLVRVKLSQNQIKALTDIEFNIGKDAFAKSTLLRKVNMGDMAGAADQFKYWNKITKDGHKIFNQQLADRRQAEANLFRAPDAKTLNLKTDIHIDGGGGSRETARETASEQKRVYGDIVRNFAGAHQ